MGVKDKPRSKEKKPRIKQVELEGNVCALIEIETNSEELTWKFVVKAAEMLVPYFGKESCLTVRDVNVKK